MFSLSLSLRKKRQILVFFLAGTYCYQIIPTSSRNQAKTKELKKKSCGWRTNKRKENKKKRIFIDLNETVSENSSDKVVKYFFVSVKKRREKFPGIEKKERKKPSPG